MSSAEIFTQSAKLNPFRTQTSAFGKLLFGVLPN